MSNKIKLELFENPAEVSSFQCPNCEMIDEKPLVINCKHFVCRDCFEKDNKCKKCDKDWEKKILFITSSLHAKKMVICPQCTWKGTFPQYKEHEKTHNTVDESDDSHMMEELKK